MNIKLKELLYYLFFGLMIAAKGMGLDSGDKLYYVLSLIAFFCIICKLCLTKYKLKEIIAMGALCLVAFIAYMNSGRLGIILSILAIIGIKDIKIDKVFRLGLTVYGICFAGTVLAAANGIIANPMVVHEKGEIGEIIRWGMGYSTGNIFHISYFILVVFIVYNLGKKYNIRHLVYLFLGNLLVFVFSFSYTGVIVTLFYLLIGYYAVKRRQLSLAERICCYLPLPLCTLFSFVMPFFTGTGVGQKLNAMLQARLSFSYYYLTNQPITLFGTRMKDVPNFWIIMDNGYVFILMTYGIVAFLLFYMGYTIVIARYVKCRMANRELAIIFSFLLYGIMEQFISNAFMNLSVLFLGAVIFGAQENENIGTGNISKIYSCSIFANIAELGERKFESLLNMQMLRMKCVKWLCRTRKWIWAAGLAGGVIALSYYIIIEEKPEYITVPVTSLNYVDAQSVILHLEEPAKTKDDLKAVLNEYQEKIADIQFIGKVLKNITGQPDNKEAVSRIKDMTPDKIAGMLEFSLPQYVHERKEYDAFRVRLLAGNSSWEADVYAEILKELVMQMKPQVPGVHPSEVESVQIGKSSGTDRIEHMTNKEAYTIQKYGNLVQIETFRTAFLRILTGCVLGCIVFSIISLLAAGKKR